MPSSAAMNATATAIQNNVEGKRLSTVPITAVPGQETAYRHQGKGGMKIRTTGINVVQRCGGARDRSKLLRI